MRLPQPLLDAQCFTFGTVGELLRALGNDVSLDELREVERLASLGLPPVASQHVLAAMFGINPGLIWSFRHRTARHYRSFTIPKGRSQRRIDAPRVALKVIQSWLGAQLQRAYQPAPHVFGFVPERSHVAAAVAHCDARWVLSLDIREFFQSTPQKMVAHSLIALGFGRQGAELIASISCLRGNLAQGSPASPVLSNIAMRALDELLAQEAKSVGVRLTRYADDIVFSSTTAYPQGLLERVDALIARTPWQLADDKTRLAEVPQRLKVHGLLVHGSRARLTKGYRNKLRAYRHLLETKRIGDDDVARVKGHLSYASFVDRVT